jgi:HNH endonuclease
MQAFILRMNPSKSNRIPEGLARNELIIGWSEAAGLTLPGLTREQFRDIIHQTYHRGSTSYIEAGLGAGNMWRFIREMEVGDLVIVPSHSVFYLARVAGTAYYAPDRVQDDTAHRRPVEWLNGGSPISRYSVSPELQSKMRGQLTCLDATDLLPEIAALSARYTSKALDFTMPPPGRVQTIESRIIRDTPMATRLKALHGDQCQLCGTVLNDGNGWTYSEAHHIWPLGIPHSGLDVAENILVLCPNHHALCDYGIIRLDLSSIRMVSGHTVGPQFVEYHNSRLCVAPL